MRITVRQATMGYRSSGILLSWNSICGLQFRSRIMRVSLPASVVRYGGAVLSVALALLITLVMWPLVRPTSSPLFLVAIVITAWLGGRGPGFLATILSGAVIDYLFITPQFQLSGAWDDLSRLTVFTVEGFTLSWVIASRKQIGDQDRKSREELRALSAHLQSMIERERGRIAREIHDELGQELTGLKFDISWLRDLAGETTGSQRQQLLDRLNSTLKSIDGAISSVRRIATELRPPVLDTLGLAAAIEWQATDFQNRTGIKCRLRQIDEDMPVSHEGATAVFRIFQEALTNVARHSAATEVEVNLERVNGRLTLKIGDNGKGISATRLSGSHSLGILGMQERVRLLRGEITISEKDGHGTVVDVHIPIEKNQGGASDQLTGESR